jgi:DNA-binding NarL/FixJ family response regulator
MSIRIILADDHRVLRQGLSQAIKNETDMEVVGQAENGQEVLILEGELLPDVIVMDIQMPELNGIEATRRITAEHPWVKVIALSMHSNKKFVQEMFKAGARGYLLKDCEYEELINAIRIVMTDEIYLSPSITGAVIEDYKSEADERNNAFVVLSDREREVLQLIAEGKTTKQIGRILRISAKTVEGHRTRIMHKLDIDSIANLTKYAIKEGLTSMELP